MAKGASAAKKAPTQKFPTDAQMRADGLEILSARIRHLASMGCSTAEITKIVRRSNGEAPRYQHVRNVLKTPLKGRNAETANAG